MKWTLLNVSANYDFLVYSHGVVHSSVCSSLTPEATVERINLENPTRISSPWALSKDKTFRTGEPNPCPCEDFPETHKHYLFVC